MEKNHTYYRLLVGNASKFDSSKYGKLYQISYIHMYISMLDKTFGIAVSTVFFFPLCIETVKYRKNISNYRKVRA